MCEWEKPKGSSFNTKLSRMVGDLKHKHKAIVARRMLLLDLIAAPPTSATITPLFPFLSSYKPSQSPTPHHFTSHIAPPASFTPSPVLSPPYLPPRTIDSPPPRRIHASRSANKPSDSSPSHHFTSHTSPPTSLTPSPPGTPLIHWHIHTSRPIYTVDSPPRHNHTSCSAPITPQESAARSARSPYITEQKALFLLSSEKKGLSSSDTSPDLSSIAACHHHGWKHFVQRTLWVATLLVLLCTFLCTGKEIAFAFAVVAHLIVWLALRLGLLARGSSAITINHTVLDTFYQQGFDKSVKQGRRPTLTVRHTQTLSRSATVPRRSGATFSTSLQWSQRSKSWTNLDSSEQEEGQSSAAVTAGRTEDFCSSMRAGNSLPQRARVSAKLKLQVVLLISLCGLFHGRTLAVCMALCCILIHSFTMERRFLKKT